MTSNFVTKAFGKLLKNKSNHDIIIYIGGEEAYFKEFYVDSKTLHNKPDFFQKIFSDNDIEKKDGKYVIKFINLPPPLLEVILKQEDLIFDEIEIWENLIKWGLAQEKTLDENVSDWDQEKFITLERILNKFIPLIRFYAISSEDYFNKVRPYEEILSKELQDEILKFHMIPGYSPTLGNHLPRYRSPDSILFSKKHFATFAEWINKNENKKEEIEFCLLYRASRDGDTIRKFHEKCDNKGATITVAKIKNSKQIVGGYNPFQWDSSNTSMSTKDSFIFSFTNRKFLQTAKVVYSNGDQYSIQCYSHCGPIFGSNNLHKISEGTVWYAYNNLSSYPALNLPSSFNIDDYEVFQVNKK